jgi:phospholipid-translocating ATPase
VNPKGKDRYSDVPDDDDVDLLGGGSPGMQGRGESDGEFDGGWTSGLPGEDEEIALLQGDNVGQASGKRTAES